MGYIVFNAKILFLKIVFGFNKRNMGEKMIRKVFPAAFAFGAALLTGCTCVRELPAKEVTSEEQRTPEYELAKEMLLAFIRNDAKGFVRRMSPKNTELLNPERFKKFRAEMIESRGEPVSFRYLTTLEMPVPFKPQIWAVRMKKMNLQNDKEFYQEILFRVVVARADGKLHVISVNFL